MHHSSGRAHAAPTVPQGSVRESLPLKSAPLESLPTPLALGLEPTALESEDSPRNAACSALLRLLGGSLLLAAGSCEVMTSSAKLASGLDNGTVSRAALELPEPPSERA